MCGIVAAFVRKNIVTVLIEGLRKLKYLVTAFLVSVQQAMCPISALELTNKTSP